MNNLKPILFVLRVVVIVSIIGSRQKLFFSGLLYKCECVCMQITMCLLRKKNETGDKAPNDDRKPRFAGMASEREK